MKQLNRQDKFRQLPQLKTITNRCSLNMKMRRQAKSDQNQRTLLPTDVPQIKTVQALKCTHQGHQKDNSTQHKGKMLQKCWRWKQKPNFSWEIIKFHSLCQRENHTIASCKILLMSFTLFKRITKLLMILTPTILYKR